MECDDADVLGVGGYEMECNAMPGCVGLGGDIHVPKPKEGVEVEVEVEEMEDACGMGEPGGGPGPAHERGGE